EVVVGTVAVVFAVRLVVLVLVTRPISEREAVVHGDVVDACARTAAVMLEVLSGSGHAMRDVADDALLTAPEASHRLAVAVIPFRPSGREGADLVAAIADVPGLGDELDVAQHRVLLNGGKERRVAVEARRAPERG